MVCQQQNFFNNYLNIINLQMNDSWHIPRASLSGGSSTGSSSNSSNKSNSNPPTVTRQQSRQLLSGNPATTLMGHSKNINNSLLAAVHNDTPSRHKVQNKLHGNSNVISNNNNTKDICDDITDDNHRNQFYRHLYHQQQQLIIQQQQREKSDNSKKAKDDSKSRKNRNQSKHHNVEDCDSNDENIGEKALVKRDSRSFGRSSTDSNSSTHSASSGSLLLTAANLERFVAIHNKQNNRQEHLEGYLNDIKTSRMDNINTSSNPNPNADDTVITISSDPNLDFIKTKDIDAISIASSTHFTMVNGIGGPPRKIKEGICSRGHQITVLILSMSMFFLIGITAMVYLLEMRAREMPQM